MRRCRNGRCLARRSGRPFAARTLRVRERRSWGSRQTPPRPQSWSSRNRFLPSCAPATTGTVASLKADRRPSSRCSRRSRRLLAPSLVAAPASPVRELQVLRQPWFDGDVQSAIDDVLVVVNEIGCAPSRYLDRTCRIEFTLVRKAGPKTEIAERKPVGWRAREWRQMLDEGVYRNQSELARGEGCGRRR